MPKQRKPQNEMAAYSIARPNAAGVRYKVFHPKCVEEATRHDVSIGYLVTMDEEFTQEANSARAKCQHCGGIYDEEAAKTEITELAKSIKNGQMRLRQHRLEKLKLDR